MGMDTDLLKLNLHRHSHLAMGMQWQKVAQVGEARHVAGVLQASSLW